LGSILRVEFAAICSAGEDFFIFMAKIKNVFPYLERDITLADQKPADSINMMAANSLAGALIEKHTINGLENRNCA